MYVSADPRTVPVVDADHVVQPGLFVVRRDQATADWLDVSNLELAIEIVSPASTRADRVVKRKTYQRHGVSTYWVVDFDVGPVEVWHPEDERPAIITEVLASTFSESAAELRISLDRLFAPLGWG